VRNEMVRSRGEESEDEESGGREGKRGDPKGWFTLPCSKS